MARAHGDSEETFEYELKSGLSIAQLQRLSEEIWAEMKRPGSLAHARAAEAGYDAATLPASLKGVVTIAPSGAGLDPGTIALIVTAGTVVARDLWKKVLLPQIEDRWGKGAIKRKNAEAKKATKPAPAEDSSKPARKKTKDQ